MRMMLAFLTGLGGALAIIKTGLHPELFPLVALVISIIAVLGALEYLGLDPFGHNFEEE